MLDSLEILYEDEAMIAVFKPHGLMVHRSPIANDAREFAVQIVRNMIGQHVYPAHRLDRKTSGVLLFTKNPEDNRKVQMMFSHRQIHKQYIAIVRGWIDDAGTIDYPLTVEEKTQDAVTHFTCLERFEIPLAFGKFETSRYSLVSLTPETGRFHQLRKHMAHILHPILGDRPHGCNKQNKLWKDQFAMTTMMLHAQELTFEYPAGQSICITAAVSPSFQNVLDLMRLTNILSCD